MVVVNNSYKAAREHKDVLCQDLSLSTVFGPMPHAPAHLPADPSNMDAFGQNPLDRTTHP